MDEKLKIIISAEVDKLKQGVDKAKQAMKGLQDKFKEASKTLKEDLEKAGEGATNIAKKIGAGFAALGASLVAAAVSTEEYRNQQAMLKTAFENAGASAETAKKTYNDLYRVMGDSDAATEAAQSLARLTADEKALGEYTTILTGIWGDYGKGMPIETIAEAVAETAACGTITGDLSRALVEAGVNEEAFNEKLAACNNEAEREKLIRETLLGLYSKSAENFEKNNAQILKQRDAQAALQEKLAKVGEALAPVITAFTNLATKALAAVEPYITNLAQEYLPKLEAILTKVGEAIGAVIKWITDNWSWISTIASVVLAIVAAFTAYNAVMTLVNAVNAIFAANPIVLAIGAIIAIIVICVKHWDDIKAAAVNAWEGIKSAWDVVAGWFKGIVDAIKNAFAPVGDWLKSLFVKAWDGIKSAWSGVKSWFNSLWEGIKAIFNAVINYYKSIFTQAWNAIKTAWGVVVDWFKGVWNGISSVFSGVGSWFSNIFTQAKNGIQNAFSTITGFFSGIWESIKNIFSNVGTAIANGIKGAVSGAVNAVLSTAAKIINGFISAINFAIDIINAIPGVNIKRLSSLSVPQMAKGGVVDSATLAVIGERGKEAVIPLENNLEWLDKLAGMLNDRMGGNQPIVLNVDGKRFGEIAVDTINGITRQRGSIPLVIG